MGANVVAVKSQCGVTDDQRIFFFFFFSQGIYESNTLEHFRILIYFFVGFYGSLLSVCPSILPRIIKLYLWK